MPALEDPPVTIGSGPRPERLFDPGGRTLDDLLRETDDALRHGRGGGLSGVRRDDGRRRPQHPGRVHRLRQPAGIARTPARTQPAAAGGRECRDARPPTPARGVAAARRVRRRRRAAADGRHDRHGRAARRWGEELGRRLARALLCADRVLRRLRPDAVPGRRAGRPGRLAAGRPGGPGGVRRGRADRCARREPRGPDPLAGRAGRRRRAREPGLAGRRRVRLPARAPRRRARHLGRELGRREPDRSGGRRPAHGRDRLARVLVVPRPGQRGGRGRALAARAARGARGREPRDLRACASASWRPRRWWRRSRSRS